MGGSGLERSERVLWCASEAVVLVGVLAFGLFCSILCLYPFDFALTKYVSFLFTIL